jgi:hypothetical protein
VAIVVDIVPSLDDRCRAGELARDALLTILVVAEPLVLASNQ